MFLQILQHLVRQPALAAQLPKHIAVQQPGPQRKIEPGREVPVQIVQRIHELFNEFRRRLFGQPILRFPAKFRQSPGKRRCQEILLRFFP
ncbi:hypothetical protein D1872_257030 [compost metagenome]